MTPTFPRSPDDASMSALDAEGLPRRFFGPDVERSRLRSILSALGAEVHRVEALSERAGLGPTALVLHYEALSKLLQLGPEPEVRTCPVCGTVGMKYAKVCGNCWTLLTPPV